MEQQFYVKLGDLYVTLFSFKDDPFFYDLCIKQKNATKFNRQMIQGFHERWKHLAQFRIRFGLEEIK